MTESNLDRISRQVGFPFAINISGLVRDQYGQYHAARGLLVAEAEAKLAAEAAELAALTQLSRNFPRPISLHAPIDVPKSFAPSADDGGDSEKTSVVVKPSGFKILKDEIATDKRYFVDRQAFTQLLTRMFSEKPHVLFKILTSVAADELAAELKKYQTEANPIEAVVHMLFGFEEYQPLVEKLIDHLRERNPEWRRELEAVRVSGFNSLDDERLVPSTYIHQLAIKFRELRMAPPDHIIREMLYASEIHPELADGDKVALIHLMLGIIGDNPNQVWLVRNLVAVVDYLSRELRAKVEAKKTVRVT